MAKKRIVVISVRLMVLAIVLAIVFAIVFASDFQLAAVAQNPEPGSASPIASDASSQPLATIWLEPSRLVTTQRDWYPGSIEKLRGEVQQFDATRIAIRMAGDEQPTVYAAARVIWIDTGDTSELQTSALRQYDEQDYTAALRGLLDSLSERPPIWRQQWLSMLAAQAAWRSSRGAIAIELVAQLDRRPLPPLVLSMLPVAWRNQRIAPEAISAASSKLSDPSAAVRLVAASWLLSTDRRDSAKQTLETLRHDASQPEIARLAETLLWRTATPPTVSQLNAKWMEKVDSLPMVFQTGPMIVVAERMESSGLETEAERLQLSLTRTPINPFRP